MTATTKSHTVPEQTREINAQVMNPITLASFNARGAMIELVNDNKDVYQASVRPEVAKFAIEMDTVLRKNDQSGWDGMDYINIFFRLRGEFNELKQTFDDCIDPQTEPKLEESIIQDMRKEAIDIANFCMFLCHNYPKKEE